MNYLRLCLFCFSFLTLQYISAQCEITDVTAEVTACEDNVFDVLIDFNHQNTTNTFTISGNGEDYGSYQYINLPITLQTLSADCITDYEFIITDDVLNNCTAFTDLGEVCCEPDCDYSNISTTPFDCIDGSFDVLIDFDYSGTLDDSFNYFTYDSESNLFDSGSALYADLPIIITIDNTTSEYFYMEFFDNNNDACSTAGEYFNPCFDESACSIINVSATASECDAGNQFSVTIDFDANNVNGQFTVSGNGMNYGNFNYFDLPIMIAGFLGDCTTEYEFVITDIEDNNCTNNTELGTICCDTPECEIVSIDFGPNPICEGDLIVTEWFIFAENTSEVGFDIFIDNEFTTFVQYNGDGPYLFDVIDNGLDFITITACDNDNPDCCFSMEIENPCYVEEVCEIGEISVVPSVCDEGDQFLVVIDFEYGNTSDQFTVVGNGMDYGVFNYAELPITIEGFLGDCMTSYEFIVSDINDNNCVNEGVVGPVCCDQAECDIVSIDFGDSPICSDGFIVTEWFIFGNNTSEVGYDIYINGEFLTFVDYNEEGPYIIEIENPGTQNFTITACDNDSETCCYTWDLENPCYEEEGECDISTFDFENTLDCVGGLVIGQWIIDGTGLSEVGFDVFVNEEFNQFVSYTESGIYNLELEVPNTEVINIAVCDNDNEQCCANITVDNPCYEEDGTCVISEILTTANECNDADQFSVVIDFEYANTSDQFTVVGNGMDYGVFNYTELPITIEGFLGDCMTTYEFIVSDINDNNCVNEGVVGPICCDQAECEIVSIDFGDSPICSDGFIVTEWFIFGNNTSEVGYDIYINGEFLTFVDYNEEGPYIIEIENPGTQNFTITACDNDSETCCYTWDLENPCYEDEGECDITTLDFENTLDCVGGLVIGQWIIDGTGLSEVGFDVFVNEEFNQFVSYTENGIYNLELEVPNTEVINIAVCDNDNEQCCANITVDNPCYEEDGNCVISEILATANECNGEDQFSVVIDFEYGNTSDQFTVVGNGVDYGVFNYADLPITIEGFLGDCMTTYEFIVSDINDNNCVNEGAVGPICCNQAECEISSIDFGDTPICSDGFIVTEWFIFGNNTSEVGYDIYINGEFLTFVDYNEEGPYNIEIENPGTQNFTITACDNNSETCCYTWDLENPCYEEEGECDISTFDFENTLDCVGGLVIGQWIIDGTGLSEVGFDVFVNEEFNQFVSYTENGIYNLELEVPNTEVINIAVCDNDNEQCCANIIVDNPCYEEDGNCVISEILATANECNDADQFSVVIDFEYGNTSDQFSVVGNETDYGVFNYADLPITIEGFLGDCMTTYEFIVSDINDNNCVNEGAVGPVCCNQAECEISSIDFGDTPICSDGFIVADWYIFGVNTSEAGYDIYINEEFLTSVEYNGEGPYNFEIENPGTQNYTITACDNNTETCCYTWASQNPCYDEGDACDITTFDFENAPECIDGLLIADWLIEGVGISEIGFNIYVNEVFNQFVPYSDNSSYDFELEVPNTEVIDVMACDSANGQCCANITFPNPCFESPVGDCVIGELEAEVVLCEESEFELVLDFDYENTSNSFTIVGNGNEYGTFLYENLPISLNLVADCVTDIEFIVSDLEIDGCQSVLEFGPVCCEDFNGFDEIIINNTIDEELINFLIEISSQLLAGCTIEVIVGGESVAILSADDMTFDLGPYECNTDQVVMVELINSCSGETAEFLLDISDVDCTTSTEELSFSELIRWDSYTKILQALPDVQEALSCQIFAMDGRLVAESDLSVAGNIDLSGLPTGIYVARISIATGTGKLGIQKIFID